MAIMPILEHTGVEARLIVFSRISDFLAISEISEAVRHN
jgi:hypothetical protein